MVSVGRMKLGSQGLEVPRQGLGCMGMSAFYGPPKPEEDMIKLIHHAVQSGITFLDTSDMYGPFINEILVGKDGLAFDTGLQHAFSAAAHNKTRVLLFPVHNTHYVPSRFNVSGLKLMHFAQDFLGAGNSSTLKRYFALKGIREKVELATKFGISYVDGNREVHGDPAYVRSCCEASLKRLDVDCIDLYYQHRIDTTVPIEVTMGELKKLVDEGKIKYVGLSEASASTIRRAHAVHPITAVQLEWSLWTRDVEEEIIPTCRELGIGIVAYSPLGRGFFSSGPKMMDSLSNDDARKSLPRFQSENLEHNAQLFERVNVISMRKGCTPSQLALAWVHHQGDDVCPIPGTTKIENLNQNIGALSVKLTPEEMAQLEKLASPDAVKGDRYGSSVWTWKDSETPPLSS